MARLSFFPLVLMCALCSCPHAVLAQAESRDFATPGIQPAGLVTELRPAALADWSPGPSTLPAGWPGNRLVAEDKPGLLFLSTQTVPLSDHARQGAWRTVPATISDGWAGRPVRVTVRGRKMPNAGADRLGVVLVTPQGASSGWRLFSLAHAERELSFDWVVPHDAISGAYTLGIWADAEGGARGAVLSFLTIEPTGPITPPPLLPPDGKIEITPPVNPVPFVAPIIATPRPMNPPPPPRAAVRPPAQPTLAWAAHIASYSDEAAAQAGWQALGRQFPRLGDYQPLYSPHKLQTGQTMVRLLAGPFASQLAADTFCTEVMDGASYCEPIRR